MAATKSSERRDGPRIDLRLRVRFEAGGHAGEAEASDVSPKGLRLESDKPIAKGTQLKLSVDAGEVEELQAVGEVTWCREHASPTGKMVYDVGVAFESDWLAKDRGPLGSALARIFAMNSYEPARNFERTPVSLNASSSAPHLELEVANLSAGGMQVRSKAPIDEVLRTGMGVTVVIDLAAGSRTLAGKVAWVAGQRPGEGPRVPDSFGIEFDSALAAGDRELLEQIRQGHVEPKSIAISLQG